MRVIGKIFTWFILIILILYATIALVLHYAIHPQTYKTALEKTVFKYTGHQMAINGPLTWSIFPHPMIKISNVLIKNQKGMGNISPYFAKISEADIQIKLLPLLSGHVEPSLIILSGANLNLVYQSAKHNPIIGAETKIAPSSSTSKPSLALKDDTTSHTTYLKHLNIPAVMVKNTNINWINLKNNSITNFKNINLVVRPSGNSATIKGSLSIINKQQQVTLQLGTELNIDPTTNIATLQNLQLKGSTTGNSATNTFNLSGNAQLNLNKNSLKVANYNLTWNNLTMTGSITDTWNITDSGFVSNFEMDTTIGNGTITEKGQYRAPNTSADSIDYNLTLKQVDIEPILKAIRYDNLMAGTINLSAKLSSTNQNHSWTQHLNGAGTFSMANAKIMQINSDNLLNQALKFLHRDSTGSNDGTTLFTTAKGTFKIHNGVFYNGDLSMEAKRINVTGSGNINLVNKTINYHLYLQHKDAAGVKVPVIISGSLHHPKIQIDYNNLGKNIISNIINKKSLKRIFNDKKFNIKGLF